MGKIKLLDDLTINKIAAGEVVEGPVSVVKELVENSIDSGAKNIVIEIKDGGRSYIRIKDDGSGFDYDDIDIAFERHATSKIRKAEDMIGITSLGFRGEALASISAISKVTLTTKKKDDIEGYRYVVEGDDKSEIEETDCAAGTTIVVENLFFNVPARLKFMKSDSSNVGKIKDLCERIALSNLGISIKFISNGNDIFRTSGSYDIITCIYELYGREIAKNVVKVDYGIEGIKVTGVIGNRDILRKSRKDQIFFVNGRCVENELLYDSVSQAYVGSIGVHKFPFVILNVEIAPDQIDVNIHPSKLEIKFVDESLVFKTVYSAIKEMILREDFIGETYEDLNAEKQDYIVKDINDNFDIQKTSGLDNITNNGNSKNISYVSKIMNLRSNNSSNLGRDGYIKDPTKKLEYKLIGVIFKTFIIIEIDNELYFVDQHAAHERVLYEKVRASYNEDKKMETQLLIIPKILSVSRLELETIMNNIDVFENLGFQIQDFGNSTIKIEGVPNVQYKLDVSSILLDTVREINSYARTTKQELENKFVATVACKAAVKAGMTLTPIEIDNLLQELFSLPNPYTCPHGRPTNIKISKEQLDDMIDKNIKF